MDLHREMRDGVEIRYFDMDDGSRVYLLPGVPSDAGRIAKESGVDFDTVYEFVMERASEDVSRETANRARRILETYKGRLIDTGSILGYALEHDRFDEIAKMLEAGSEDFSHIHPNLMMARTDVTAFFLELYRDLGIAPSEDVEGTIEFNRRYGPGLQVWPEVADPDADE